MLTPVQERNGWNCCLDGLLVS
uniref:Uncharacterized protein n=1 Tax=Anguilla anguilla TaxID=7936 RepID=A0A0E9V6V9_ANGAN